MSKIIISVLVLLFVNVSVFANNNIDSAFTESSLTLHTSTGDIFGTLTLPKNFTKGEIALIIAGAGPTDRNGNNPVMKNESLRMLAHHLSENNIASLRYDKRGVGESMSAAKSEADLRFENYIDDAKEWIGLLKKR